MEDNYKQLIRKQQKLLKIQQQKIKELENELNIYKSEIEIDTLTKLNNRKVLENIDGFGSIILGDIDHFKDINDSYGHLQGDEVLMEIGNILKNNIRENDIACRWGGEEFLVLLKNCNEEMAFNRANNLKEEIEKLSEKFGFNITMSFGVSTLDNRKMQNAIGDADRALYRSKKMGRNRVTCYSKIKDIKKVAY